MNIDYVVIAIVGLVALAIILFTIKKNNKEEKKFEGTIYEEEVTKDKHDDL
ncbi:mannose/fructose/N-acetylgalactosamine-specific phosphotransferase system component IIC [Pedobacter sp. UYEF25]